MKSQEYLQTNAQFPDYLKPYIENMDDLVRVNESVFGFRPRIEAQKIDAESKRRTLLIVTGFSGAGKDSSVNALIDMDKRFGWVKTCTTRERRDGETEENDPYIRISEKEFMEKRNDGDVIEWVWYSEHYSCSLESVFMKAFKNFEIPILRPDPKGTKLYTELWQRQERFFRDVNLITVFVAPPSMKDLEARLWKRKDATAEIVKRRMGMMEVDVPYLCEAEYIAINENDQLDKVVRNIQKLISS